MKSIVFQVLLSAEWQGGSVLQWKGVEMLGQHDTVGEPQPSFRIRKCFVVQSLSRVRLFATLWIAACQASLSFTISWSLFKLMFIESVMLSSHLNFSSCPQSFPASGSFPVSRLFTSDGWSWFPLGLTGLISLKSKGLSRVIRGTTGQKHQFFGTQPFL